MNWTKLTDTEGKVDESKLPKDDKEVLVCNEMLKQTDFAYYNGHWINSHTGFDLDYPPTHIALIHGPNEPQPEDGLVDLLKRCDKGIKDCFHLIGHVQSAHPISKHCFNDLQWAQNRLREQVKYGEIEQALAKWEAGR